MVLIPHRRSKPELIRDLRSIVAQNETDIQRLWKSAKRAEMVLPHGIYLPPEQASSPSSSSPSSSSCYPCARGSGDCCLPESLTVSVTTWNWAQMVGAIIHDWPNHFPQTFHYTTEVTNDFTGGEPRWRGPCFEAVETSGGVTQKRRYRLHMRCHPTGASPTSPYPFLQEVFYDTWPQPSGPWDHSNSTCDGTIYEITSTTFRTSDVDEYEYTCEPFYMRVKKHYTNGTGADIQFEVTE